MEADKIKESIKRAAQELFRKFGYHKTSVNEIAKRAKIAKATIYKYFESKEDVLHSLLMDYIKVSVDELIHSNTPELEEMLVSVFSQLSDLRKQENYLQRLRFLIKCSKSIVFSFAFTSVSDSDVKKNFVSFQKEILPYLVKAAITI